MSQNPQSGGPNGMLDAEAVGASALRQERPAMRLLLSQERLLPAIFASAIGVGVSALMHTPFGLLTPIVALFLYSRRHTDLVLLYAVLATGLVGSLVATQLYVGEARAVAGAWAEFFIVAICIG